MRPFAYARANGKEAAVRAAAGANRAGTPVAAPLQFIAGGTSMTDLMRLGVMAPRALLDLNGLADDGAAGAIEESPSGLRLGALVRMAEAETHPAILARYPVIADSLRLAASPQIRNMASLGGNLLQRTRCEYFRGEDWACNKRAPGVGCAAIEGVNRMHAILGTSEHCIATYPGDLAQALIAVDATLEIATVDGPNRLSVAQLHRLPGDTPHIETNLGPADLITAIHVPAAAWTARSRYVKVRDRDSYAFALAAAAVALDLQDGVVREARIALGGVATVPWRARPAEDALRGRPLDEAAANEAAEATFAEARPHRRNAFKVPLGKRTLVRALLEARDMEVPNVGA